MITPLKYYYQNDTNTRHSNGSCAIIFTSRTEQQNLLKVRLVSQDISTYYLKKMQNALSEAGLRYYFFTKKELASFLKYKSTKSIDRLVSAGKLKPTRLTDKAIRFYGKDVEALLNTGGAK